MSRRLLSGVLYVACLASPAALAGTDGGVSPPAPLDVSTLSLDARGIRAVIDHHLPTLRACYELALVDGGRSNGKVKLDFTVAADGTVREVSVRELGDGLRQPRVNQCLEQALVQMEFPRPADGQPQPIQLPLILTAVE